MIVGVTIPVPLRADPHRDQGELKCQSRQKPEQIGHTRRHCRLVRRQRRHVTSGQSVSEDERGHCAQAGQSQALIEDEIGVRPVLAPARLCDEHHRAHAQDLRDGHDEELYVPCRAHAGDRHIAEATHEVEVHEDIHRLEHHPDRDRDRQLHDVTRDRPLGQILHRLMSTERQAV